MMRSRLAGAGIVCSLLLGACGEKEPVRIGYLGGLTGRTADLGTGGRNGVQIAVDRINAAGGIKGRKVELLVKDDENDPEKGRRAVHELVKAKVDAIVGPMTSNVAVAVAPEVAQAKVLMMGGSVTTNDLTARDDMFFRTIAASTVHAATMAAFLHEKRGVRRVNAAVNLSNKAYSESWIENFSRAFEALGGRVERRVPYASGPDADFYAMTRDLLSGNPHAVILVTSAVDAALFANQVRVFGGKSLMVTTEWAGTGRLTELGGANVEGYIVPQYLDRDNATPQFVEFRTAYQQRFQQEVGFPALVAYNGVQAVFRAMSEMQPGESLKQALLRLRTFDGLQGSFAFDDFGDVQNKTYLTEVRDGRYQSLR